MVKFNCKSILNSESFYFRGYQCHGIPMCSTVINVSGNTMHFNVHMRVH